MRKPLPAADRRQLYRLVDHDASCAIPGYQTRFTVFSIALYQYLREHTAEFPASTAAQGDRDPLNVRPAGTGRPDAGAAGRGKRGGEWLRGNCAMSGAMRGSA